jgi:aspartyl-tRNA(Asn)/glutamyl-tRNA(Gln) amidotransferase subunit A
MTEQDQVSGGATLPTASRLLAGYREGTLSPVEAIRAALARIDAEDGELNAYCLVDPEGALAAAEASGRRWAAGNPRGLLDGVPVSIKDMLLTRGWPTRKGSTCVPADGPWEVDAPATARLREQNAVLLGKTTLPELAWKGVGDSPLTGITRNPWDPRLTPGGSSGGSAAAVAAGMGVASVGTDGGGSVRIPAAFCGLVGFKPTFGRISAYPTSPFGTLSHTGPLAWSVDDVALMLDVLSVPDARDPGALPAAERPLRESSRREVRGLRAAFSPDLGYVSVDPEVAGLVETAVTALGEAGLHVTRTDPGFSDPREAFDVLWCTGAANVVNGFADAAAANLDPGLAQVWRAGNTYSAQDYLAATAVKNALGTTMGLFHESYDVLLTPTVPIPAFEAGHDVPPGSGMRSWPDWTPCTYPFNMTQQPAATVPAGLTSDGLPVGLQVIGPRYSDGLVLAVCRLLESVRPWAVARP